MVDPTVQIDLGGEDVHINHLYTGATGPGQAGTLFVGAADAVSLDGVQTITGAKTFTAAVTQASNSSKGLAVGLNGATNPSFAVDNSTTSQVAGLSVKGAAHNGTVAVAVTDSSGAANLTINALSTGTIGIGTVSTGAVTITPATTITGASTLTGAATFNGGIVNGSASTTKSNAGAHTCSSNAATTTTQYSVITSESLTTAHTASQALVITYVGTATTDFAVATIIGGSNTGGVPVLKTACTTDTVTITIQNNAIATNAFNGTFIIWLQVFKG